MEEKDAKAKLRRERGALERRKGDVISAARAWAESKGDGRTKLADLRVALEDLTDSELRVTALAALVGAEEGRDAAHAALAADAGPDAHGDGGATTHQGALDLEAAEAP